MSLDGVTAGAACVTAGVAVVATFIARSQLKHVRTDSRERSRPMMAAELRRPPHVPGTQLLVVRNYGSSIARQVVVTFDPPIPDPSPEKAARSVSPFIRRRYAETISVTTPGMELSNIWFSGVAGTGGRWENFEPTPERFTVTFTYQGPDGYPYEDAIQLDTGLIRTETLVTSSTSPENQIKEGVKSLATIQGALTQIARTLSSPRDSDPQQTQEEDDADEAMMRQLLGERYPDTDQRDHRAETPCSGYDPGGVDDDGTV